MATFAKGSAFLFLMTLFAYSVTGQEGKIKVASPKSLSVSQDPKVAVPIEYTAGDYTGPYDPLDPKGIHAALHRQAKIEGKKNLEVVKSYIPPGLNKMVKKEGIKLAVDEGRRFAVSHPKETADLIGIATKAKGLYDLASHKLKNMEKQQEKQKSK